MPNQKKEGVPETKNTSLAEAKTEGEDQIAILEAELTSLIQKKNYTEEHSKAKNKSALLRKIDKEIDRVSKELNSQINKKPEVVNPVKEKKEAPATPEAETWSPEDEATYNEALKEIEEARKIITEEKEKNLKKEERLREIDARLVELDALEKDYSEAEAEKKAENKENEEVKTYHLNFVKEEITKILLGVKAIKNIEYLNIQGKENEILIDARLNAKKYLMTVDVEINATLTNVDGKIAVAGYHIDAGALSSIVESLVKEKLDQVSELIKNKIEEKEKIKVEKVWIEDGELKAL